QPVLESLEEFQDVEQVGAYLVAYPASEVVFQVQVASFHPLASLCFHRKMTGCIFSDDAIQVAFLA
ncbi:hypothetical protein OFC41_30460, partial [Escherichia coli]|nr:hypothetical protein [Escherichia coli]